MPSGLLLYGANGFVGETIARRAAEQGLPVIVAGRDRNAIARLADELHTPHRVFAVDDSAARDAALRDVQVVLNCAGPFMYTARPLVESCLRGGVHYVDITGEIPVYEALLARDDEAKTRGVMLLPGAGFDVVPTDCLAAHLKRRLPTATRLTLAFSMRGPAGLPPGTQRTMIELARYGVLVRRDGRLQSPESRTKTLAIDFGAGPRQATLLSWGDVFEAYRSTGIANIEVYATLSAAMRAQLLAVSYLRPLFAPSIVRRILRRTVRRGPTQDECAATTAHVWGSVEDDDGGRATARLHGPEAAVVWTAQTALAAVQRILKGAARPGYQTPAQAFGAEFVFDVPGVVREDVA